MALKMKVIAYDPFLSEERAKKLGVHKVELDELYRRADFITLHVPATDQTRGMISAEAITKMKPGVRIINCARGGLVDEAALAEGLKSGQVAGAAFDVFEVEPATKSPLFNLPNVVVTPHLGASTTEAQENVALQVAEQMSDYLLTGAVTNALNMPSVTAEEAAVMGPWVELAKHLGAFVGQLTEEPINEIAITYNGNVSELNTAALNAAAVAGISERTAYRVPASPLPRSSASASASASARPMAAASRCRAGIVTHAAASLLQGQRRPEQDRQGRSGARVFAGGGLTHLSHPG